MSDIYLVNTSWVWSVPFFYNDEPVIYYEYPLDTQNFAWNFEEDRHNFAGIEIQAEVS